MATRWDEHPWLLPRDNLEAKERGGAHARNTLVDVPVCDPLFASVVDFRPVAAEAQRGPLPLGLTPLILRYPPWADFCRQTSYRTYPRLSEGGKRACVLGGGLLAQRGWLSGTGLLSFGANSYPNGYHTTLRYPDHRAFAFVRGSQRQRWDANAGRCNHLNELLVRATKHDGSATCCCCCCCIPRPTPENIQKTRTPPGVA